MIDTLGMGRLQTASGTNPGFFIEGFGFGLNTCDEKHVDLAFSNESVHFKLKKTKYNNRSHLKNRILVPRKERGIYVKVKAGSSFNPQEYYSILRN
jgi:hypothetical protein